ncbi:MAG: hypothetical protein ACJ71J_16155 [Nitrososphaeraceae archaeon]
MVEQQKIDIAKESTVPSSSIPTEIKEQVNHRQQQRQDNNAAEIERGTSQIERLQLIDLMKAPIIERGRNLGYEVIENYDIYGAGVIHVVWRFKPGASESLPDIKLGFVCLTNYSEFSLNLAIARGLLNVIDKLVIVLPEESMTKPIKDSIESMPQNSILQLRKYITVLTPTTLVSKTGIEGNRDRDSSQTGELL